MQSHQATPVIDASARGTAGIYASRGPRNPLALAFGHETQGPSASGPNEGLGPVAHYHRCRCVNQMRFATSVLLGRRHASCSAPVHASSREEDALLVPGGNFMIKADDLLHIVPRVLLPLLQQDFADDVNDYKDWCAMVETQELPRISYPCRTRIGRLRTRDSAVRPHFHRLSLRSRANCIA